MSQMMCLQCGWVFDSETGSPDYDIPPGMPFDDLPDGWECPYCGAAKMYFEAVE